MTTQLQERVRRPIFSHPPGRVLVGMSGGVDSSVVAALLKEAGFSVLGMTMQIWHRSSSEDGPQVSAGCCTVDAVDDARAIARRLEIPYYVPNFREPFSVVVDNFAEEYAAGRTPNPCVRCNQHVRFDGLLKMADDLQVEYVATGHYAGVEFDEDRQEYVLLRAADPAKDQSYVLHTLTQAHLARLILPLGGFVKSETRQLAMEFDLPVASKADSQEICFVGNGDYRAFLEQVSGLRPEPGPIVDAQGEVVGQHAGIHNFTVGQRKGLNLGGPQPSFVIALRPAENAVVVGRREDAMSRRLECADVHLISSHESATFQAAVRVRSHGSEMAADITRTDARTIVEFHEPVWGVTPGQSAVFYDGDRVIGGGTIVGVTP